MARRLHFVLGLAPCVAVLATAAFAQAPTATTTTTTAAPPPAAPAAVDTNATTTTTTTTAPAPGMDVAPPPAMPRTGGDPASFVLIGGVLSGSMLALRRRLNR